MQNNWLDTFQRVLNAGLHKTGEVCRFLFWGPPGTGKTSAPYHSGIYGPDQIFGFTCHYDAAPEEITGGWALRGGDSAVVYGQAARAMRAGGVFLVDEIDQASPSLSIALHAVCNDINIAGLVMPDGELVKPEPGFIVVATMNPDPFYGAPLHDALLDRFDLILYAKDPAPGILEKIGEADLSARRVLEQRYSRLATPTAPDGQPLGRDASVRTLETYLALVGAGWDRDEAANLIWGSCGPEVVSMLANQAA